MLRRTLVDLHYRADVELDRIRGMLLGRAKLERRVGLKKLFFLMRTQTRYRVELRSYYERAIVRKNVDSAAQEHGTGWQYLRNDLARQNVMLLPRMQQTLARYEPLAFRAVVELCGSHIAPPPPPLHAQIPEEAYSPQPRDPRTAHPAARRELREGVTRMLKAGLRPQLAQHGPPSAEEWMEAWREFDTESSFQQQQQQQVKQ